MLIIGCDYHPGFQQVALVNTETGELRERRLMHREEAEQYYRALGTAGAEVRVGMEASGHAGWFERLLAELSFELWMGDAAKIAAKRVRKQKTDRRDAQHILTLMLKDDFPKIWMPSWEIFLGNNNSGNVTVVDGTSNTAVTLTNANTDSTWAIALNPVTNTAYFADYYTGRMAEVTEQQVQQNPLVTWIDPLTDNQTTNTTPTFNLTANSAFWPTAPTPQAVWYQLDTWQGPWTLATGTAPNFTITTPTLSLGTHILYAFATDGQDATSTGAAQPFIGSMAAYVFTVTVVPTKTPPRRGCTGRVCRL